jgi:hypothetical protein
VTRPRTPARHLALAVALLLLMAAIRLHNLTLQEPFIDEGAHVQRARVVWSFDEHPGRFANGKLLLYYWLGLFELPPISALWIARTAIALASLLTGAAVYAIARMAGSAGAGALALAAYAVLPLAFFFERMALADPFAAMFAALAVWQSVRFARRPTVRAAIAVGLLCAAATLAKLTTGLVPLIPLAAALACFPPRGNNRSVWWYEWRRRYGTGIALAWGIVVLCWLPVVVPAAVAQVRGDPFTLVNGANLADLGEPAPLAELRAAIPAIARYTSAPLLVGSGAALIGLAWRARRDPSLRTWAAALIAWTVLLALLPPVASRNVRTRYFMPLAAPLSVTAGCTAWVLWRARRPLIRLAVASASAIWLAGFAIPFALTAVRTPDDLRLPPNDAAVFLGGNFAGDAMREAARLIDAADPSVLVLADRATCDMLTFFTARPITCADDIARPVELLNAPESYVVLNGHEPQPERLRLVWELVGEFERPALQERAGVTRTVQVWRVRAP